jgi:hypothetical protein
VSILDWNELRTCRVGEDLPTRPARLPKRGTMGSTKAESRAGTNPGCRSGKTCASRGLAIAVFPLSNNRHLEKRRIVLNEWGSGPLPQFRIWQQTGLAKPLRGGDPQLPAMGTSAGPIAKPYRNKTFIMPYCWVWQGSLQGTLPFGQMERAQFDHHGDPDTLC